MPDFDLDAILTGPPTGPVLERPLNEEETRAMWLAQHRIEGVVLVELADVIEWDLDGFLDAISEKLSDVLVGSIDYEVVGVSPPGTLFVKVTAGEVLDVWAAGQDDEP